MIVLSEKIEKQIREWNKTKSVSTAADVMKELNEILDGAGK